MDGRGVLAAMQSEVALRRIPVVVLSTSVAPEDVAQCYDLGASAYIGKPVTFDELLNVFRTLEQWLSIVIPAPRYIRDDAEGRLASIRSEAAISFPAARPGYAPQPIHQQSP